jgi:hypothetical protein
MLARLVLVLISLPAVALAQDGAAPARTLVPAPKPSPAADVAPVPPAPPPPLPAWSLPTDAAYDAGAADCRTSCAQSNYFCRASDQPDSCGTAWGQCVAACDLPNLVPPSVSTAP